MTAWLVSSYCLYKAARLLVGGLLVLVSSAWAVAAGAAAPAGLDQLLYPDGTVRPGASGSFDASGFRMYTGPDGQPVFRPTQVRRATGAGDDQWRPDFGPAGTDEKVKAVMRVGSDLYIGGQFTAVGNVGANHIARWDGTAWHALGTGPTNGTNGDVLALAASGNTVYAGGNFSTAGGQRANYVAAWNGSAWQALGPAPALGVNSTVYALAVLGTTLYAGGSFSQAGGQAADFLASWNGISWRAVGGGVDGTVNALLADGGRLYAGGYFARAGTVSTSHIACWDGSTWSALGTGTGVGGTVYALASDGVGHLYAGGSFVEMGGMAARNVARWDGTTWQPLGTGTTTGTIGGTVYALACAGTRVYVGGNFSRAGGGAAANVACWENGAWTATASGVNAEVRALAATGTDVWAGGHFYIAGEVGANYISHWTGTAWEAVGAGLGIQSYGLVLKILAVDSVLYVGGTFETVGTVPANNVARWDGHAWSTLGTGPTNGTNGSVWELLLDGSQLYAGGDFTQAGGAPARNVARWDGSRWQALGTGVDNIVYALAKIGSRLYAGGEFTLSNGRPTALVNQWNGTGWTALPLSSFTLQGNGVTGLAVLDSVLIIGGNFTFSNFTTGFAVNGLVQWDGTSWGTVGGAYGFYNNVYRKCPFAVADSVLYIGTTVSFPNSITVGPLARWDGTNWSSFGGALSPGGISALAVSGGNVYVGGFFYRGQSPSSPYNFIARWNGRNWASLGTGLNQECRAIATMPGGRLAIGGHFDASFDGSVRMLRFGIYADSLLPVLTGIAMGGSAPGAPFTLSGTNLAGATAVTFTTVGGGPITVNTGFVVNANGTQLTGLTVPPGVVSSLVTVTTATGVSNGVLLQLYQPPVLTSVTPGSALPTTPLTLTGLNLTGTTTILFTGPGGTTIPAAPGFVVNAAGTQITGLQVPAGAITGSITLVAIGGTGSLPFAVPYPPVLTSLTPASAPAGGQLTLNGTGLSGASAITFAGPGGAPAAVTSGFVVNAAGTQVTGVVIPATAVSGLVTLTTPRGTSNGLPLLLILATTASQPAPSLRISPNPAVLYTTVQVPPASTVLPLIVLDATGREVRRSMLAAGTAATRLEIAGLATGLYVVRYGSATARLVVE